MLRFAPSPTGDMHIGTLRVAILNYLVSLQKEVPLTVRIADTDKEKNIEGKDTEIMQILEKFALAHESVFHQSEHLHMHQTLAIRLLEEEKAFVCTCSEDEIEAEKEKAKKANVPYTYSGKCYHMDKSKLAKLKEDAVPFVLRIKKPEEDIAYHDLIQGDMIFTPEQVDSFVILRADSTPSLTFASACDDIIGGVNFILEEDHSTANVAKQIHAKNALGYDAQISYAHIPKILGTSDKVSNETDDTSTVKWLFSEGFVPDAIINYLILLGFEHAPKQIFTLPEAIEWFRLENISKDAVKFNVDVLRYLNAEHLKCIGDIQLSSLFGFADADIGKLAKLYLNEVHTINELALKIRPFFAPKDTSNQWGEEMKLLADLIQDAPMFSAFDDFKSYLMNASKIKEENCLNALRYVLTGTGDGPELSELYPHIKSYLLEIATCTPSSTL